MPAVIDTLSPQPAASPELVAGSRLARFRIEGRLGAGAMGIVYAAHDEQLNRRVAIKLMANLHGSAATDRFLREAQVMARLQHPNVVTIHEAGEIADQLFIVMELVEGETVASWLTRPHPWREALALFLAAGRGLAAAHDAGIVHRDFKPSNVLVGDGRPRVGDFGLAWAAGDREDFAAGSDEPLPETPHSLTQTGMALGTPAYMAPEQRAGERATAASDQYAFCVALWEALAGARPNVHAGTDAATRAAKPRARAAAAAPQPRTRRIPRALRRALERGLAEDPEDRWPSMPALLAALEAGARRRTVVAAVAVLAIAGGGTAIAIAAAHAATPDGCGDTHARLAGVWDDTRRADMRAAFATSKLPYADKTFEASAGELDRYASEWADRVDATCRDDLPRATAQARRACLDRRLTHFRAWVDAFTHPTPELIKSAPYAAGELESLETCNDPDANSLVPADPLLAAQVDALSSRIEVAAIHASYGDMAAGLGELRELQKLAKSLDYPPIDIDVLAEIAGAQVRTSDYKGGLATWTEVRDLAEAAHHDLSRARAWNGLAMTYADLGMIAQSHDAARVAGSIVKPLVGYEPDQVRVAIHNSEGYALWAEGKRDEALVEMLAALHGEQELYKDAPYRTAGTESDIGALLTEMHRDDEAMQYFEASRQKFLSVEGDSHPALAAITNNEGNVLFHKGDYAGAEARYREAAAIRDRVGVPADNLARGYDALNLGETLVHLGKADEAAASLATARDIIGKQASEDVLEYAEALTWSGNAELARNRPADALPWFERAIAIYGHHAETVPTDRAVADLGLAHALWDARPADRARARELATHAADAFAAAKDPRADDARAWLAAHAKP